MVILPRTFFLLIGCILLFFLVKSLVYATAPTISNISVSVSETTATFTWTTDQEANSFVDYGTSEDYDSTGSDTSYVTSHSITLSGLTKGTTYHYTVISVNSSSQRSDSGDNTFTTSGGSSTTTTTTTTTTVTKIVTATPTPTPTPDIVPPTVRLTSNVEKAFTLSPLLEGTASDVSGVVSAAYSLDEGKTWNAVSELKGGTSVRFAFTPPALDDGSYIVRARATDGFGNTGAAKPVTMVIDRLPPRIGTTVLAFGPQIITPDSFSVIYALSGIPYRLYVAAVGGPTTVDLFTTSAGSVLSASSSANFVKNLESGLWSTTLTFTDPGSYTLSTFAIDGAKNQSTRQLLSLEVLAAGKVESESGDPIEDTTLTVFFQNTLTNEYLPWDASPWGLLNPINSDKDGTYYLVLPQGRYFIEASHPRYQSARTTLFELTRSTPISVLFKLSGKQALSLGAWQLSLPSFLDALVNFSPDSYKKPQQTWAHYSQVVGKEIAPFTFYTSDQSISHVSIRGKPTLITFLNTWSTHASQQLPVLDALTRDSSLGIYAVAPFEGSRKVEIFRKRGSYAVPMFADPDGDLAQSLDLSLTPLHVFLDRRGTIRDIKVGVLKWEELRDNLVR